MLEEEVEGFQKWVRQRGGQPSSVLITMPGTSFTKSGQTYRSDIKWMWKALGEGQEQVRLGSEGYISLLLTDEPALYQPSTNVIKGSFEDSTLMWSWILYVTKHSWWKQKRGKLRLLFDQLPFSSWLRTLTIKILEEA